MTMQHALLRSLSCTNYMHCVLQMQGFGPLGKLHPEFVVSLCHMVIGSRLHRLSPAVFAPPLMTATSLNVPYRTIMVARYRDFCIALGLFGLLVALAIRLLV